MSLILLNKPFQVLTRFTSDDDRTTLSDYINAPGFYPAGRLDYDSEGLLLLTDDGRLQAELSHPRWKVSKTYLVQVEHTPDQHAIASLAEGIQLNDGITLPAEVEIIDEPEWLWPRVPPIRFRKMIGTAWLKLSIREGRNRQVRRMTAAVGHPTLRLIRYGIGPWTIEGLASGQWRHSTAEELRAFRTRRIPTEISYSPRRKSPIKGRN